MRSTTQFNLARDSYQKARIVLWDSVAHKRDAWQGWGKFYHGRVEEIHHFLINPGQRVLEIGCGMGDLLASLQPARGVGVDFSPETISARPRVPRRPRICRGRCA